MKTMIVTAFFLLCPCFAQDYSLSIDGQTATRGAITVDGQIYVPLDALSGAGSSLHLSLDFHAESSSPRIDSYEVLRKTGPRGPLYGPKRQRSSVAYGHHRFDGG